MWSLWDHTGLAIITLPRQTWHFRSPLRGCILRIPHFKEMGKTSSRPVISTSILRFSYPSYVSEFKWCLCMRWSQHGTKRAADWSRPKNGCRSPSAAPCIRTVLKTALPYSTDGNMTRVPMGGSGYPCPDCPARIAFKNISGTCRRLHLCCISG